MAIHADTAPTSIALRASRTEALDGDAEVLLGEALGVRVDDDAVASASSTSALVNNSDAALAA
jgi:hypothetical protein